MSGNTPPERRLSWRRSGPPGQRSSRSSRSSQQTSNQQGGGGANRRDRRPGGGVKRKDSFGGSAGQQGHGQQQQQQQQQQPKAAAADVKFESSASNKDVLAKMLRLGEAARQQLPAGGDDANLPSSAFSADEIREMFKSDFDKAIEEAGSLDALTLKIEPATGPAKPAVAPGNMANGKNFDEELAKQIRVLEEQERAAKGKGADAGKNAGKNAA